MKKLFLFAIAVLLVCGCTDSGIDETPYGGSDNTENPGDGNDSEDEKPDIPEYSINGSVQKGQFIQGSVVTIQELNERLQPTGKSYQTQILDDMGSFELTSDIDSRYVEIIAEGFYFNEVTGNLSDAPLTLRSLSDLAMEGKANVNLLTSLETPRIKYLVLNEGRTIPDARRTAEQEVLRSFCIPQDELPSPEGFDKMDIARPGVGNAILLAISATLQHGRTVAQLSEIVSKIATDIEVNGQIKDEALLAAVRSNGMGIKPARVTRNLERRYEELSITDYAIPPFDEYLDIDGNGVIDKLDDWFDHPFEERFELIFEPYDIEMRSFNVQVTPNFNDTWYYVGITTASYFDSYDDWRQFIQDMTPENSYSPSLYMDREILQINCIPGTEYVIYGFLDTNDFPNNIFIARVTSKPLPRNMNATVQAEWQLYDGTALETLYPDIYKGASDHRVFIFQVTPTSPETIHTWGLLHVARSTQLNLSDMQILDYLETGTLFGWKNVENGYYFLPAEMETFGFYYCGQDESGAWGELYYEELTFTEDDLCDPKSAPNSGFINGKSAVTPNRTALIATAFTAPVRFCKAAEYGRTPHLLPN